MFEELNQVCPKCLAELPLTPEYFHRDRGCKTGFRRKCKRCSTRSAQQWNQENRERYNRNWRRHYARHTEQRIQHSADYYEANALKVKRSSLHRQYGLTRVEYEAMLVVQNGCCAICGGTGKSGNQFGTRETLCVDHDHGSGKVRGLLCCNCNCLLGHAKDNAGVLLEAIHYLERNNNE